MTDDFTPKKPLTSAQIAARKAFRAEEAKSAVNDHNVSVKAFDDNRERLKAERLAREAAAKKP